MQLTGPNFGPPSGARQGMEGWSLMPWQCRTQPLRPCAMTITGQGQVRVEAKGEELMTPDEIFRLDPLHKIRIGSFGGATKTISHRYQLVCEL